MISKPRQFYRYFLLLISLIFSTNLAAIEKTVDSNLQTKQPQKVNRRVLILDFVNTQKAPDYAYLEDTIADSFLEPLDKTKIFTLLPRSGWKKLLDDGKYKKEQAAREDVAARAGQEFEADVVVIGSYAASGDHMQIFAKAIEVPGGRIILTRNKSAPLDNYMFDSIAKLAEEMSVAMKDKLPPMEQKVVTQERIITDTSVTVGGMFWRNMVLPGLGHLYASQPRGWIYMGLWAGSAGALTYFFIDYNQKLTDYQNATSGLDAKYEAANLSSKMRGYMLIALASVYVVTVGDTLIFGKAYEKVGLNQKHDSILAMMAPEYSKTETGIYAGLEFKKRF